MPRVAEDALAVGIGAAADQAAVAEQHHGAPRPGAGEAGGEIVQRHGFGRMAGSAAHACAAPGLPTFGLARLRLELIWSLVCELLHVGAEPLVLVRDEVEEQALGRYCRRSSSVICSMSVLDLADHVLEGPLELALGGELAVEGLEQRQQVAVERHLARPWSS